MASDIHNSILVAGCGASGLAAALTAARKGAAVTCIDHNGEPGKKLLLTGNGRCNFTNTDVSISHYSCSDPAFIDSVLNRFGYSECVSFFREIGIEADIRHYRYDDTGYAYPKDTDAAGLRDALYKAAVEHGVRFIFNAGIEEKGISTFRDASDGKAAAFCTGFGAYDKIILATGSNAYPLTGSDSSAYPVLMSLGIDFNGFYPALCALYSKDETLKTLKGKRVTDTAELIINGRNVMSAYGEIQFNEHSISGIPVMQLSGTASKALRAGKNCAVVIGGREYAVYRTAGFDKSQCCGGGVSLDGIDKDTLMIKHIPGIHICGELLDIYGDCGGYNLHFAWASGYIAGLSAAIG